MGKFMDVHMCTDYYLIVSPIQIRAFKQEEPRYSQGSSPIHIISAHSLHGPTSISAGISTDIGGYREETRDYIYCQYGHATFDVRLYEDGAIVCWSWS